MTWRPQLLVRVLVSTLAFTTLVAGCQANAEPEVSAPTPSSTPTPVPVGPTSEPAQTAERVADPAVPNAEPPCGVTPAPTSSNYIWLLCTHPVSRGTVPLRVSRPNGSAVFDEPTPEESAAGLWSALPPEWNSLTHNDRQQLGSRVRINAPLPTPTNEQLIQLLYTLVGPPGPYWYFDHVEVCGDTCARYGWTDTHQPQRLECSNQPAAEIPPPPIPGSYPPDDAAIGDLDGDGLPDSYLPGSDADPAYVLFGNGTLSPPLRPLGKVFASVDFNNDGADELLVSAGGASGHGAAVAGLVDGCFLEALSQVKFDTDELEEQFLIYMVTGNWSPLSFFGISCPQGDDSSRSIENGRASAIIPDLNNDGVIDHVDTNLARLAATVRWEWSITTLQLHGDLLVEARELRRSGVAANRADLEAIFSAGGNCPAGESWF